MDVFYITDIKYRSYDFSRASFGRLYWTTDQTLIFNYTHVIELYGDQYNLAPRMNLLWAQNHEYPVQPGEKTLDWGVLHWIDLDLEAEIGVGKDWKFSDI